MHMFSTKSGGFRLIIHMVSGKANEIHSLKDAFVMISA